MKPISVVGFFCHLAKAKPLHYKGNHLNAQHVSHMPYMLTQEPEV